MTQPQPQSPDEISSNVARLIEESSFGTTGARQLRARTAISTADAIRARAFFAASESGRAWWQTSQRDSDALRQKAYELDSIGQKEISGILLRLADYHQSTTAGQPVAGPEVSPLQQDRTVGNEHEPPLHDWSEAAAVLQVAQCEAAKIVADARQQADRSIANAEAYADEQRYRAVSIVREAREEADRILADAKKDAEQAAAALREAREEADRILADAKKDAEQAAAALRDTSFWPPAAAQVWEETGHNVQYLWEIKNDLPEFGRRSARSLRDSYYHGRHNAVSAVPTQYLLYLLLTGGGDETVRVWDLASGTPAESLRGHTGLVRAVALLPDGRMVSSGGDGTVRVWDLASGTQAEPLRGHTGLVRAAADQWLPDGTTVIVTSRGDGTVRRQLRIWADNPSLAKLNRQSGGFLLPPSTVSDVLSRSLAELRERERTASEPFTARELTELRQELQASETALPETAEARPAPPAYGQLCALFAVDIAGFTRPDRDDDIRLYLREKLYQVLHKAFDYSGIPWANCFREDRGDGILIVVPPGVPYRGIIDPLPERLRSLIRQHNHVSSNASGIQLRAAAHIGPVEHDDHGFIGSDINLLFRMLEARPLKRTLAASSAELGLIVSDDVYRNLVCRYPSLVSPNAFRPNRFRVKHTRARAWIYLPGAKPMTRRGTYDSGSISHDRKPSAGPIQVEIQEASEDVSAELQIAEGAEVISRHERRFIDGTPWAMQTSFYPMGFADRGADQLRSARSISEGVIQYLAEKLHIHQVGFRDWVTVRAPNATEVDFFKLPADDSVLMYETVRTAFDEGGQPIRLTITVYPAERNQFVLDVGQVPERQEDTPAFVELESIPPVTYRVLGIGQPLSHPTKEGDRREHHPSEESPPSRA